MKTRSLSLSFILSLLVHVVTFLLTSTIMINDRHFRRPDLIQIRLVDLSHTETPPLVRTRAEPEEIIRSPFRRRDIEKPKDDKRAVKEEVARAERRLPRLPTAAKEEPAKTAEPRANVGPMTEPTRNFGSNPRAEGGGSEAGAGNLDSHGDVAVATGPSGGGGGTAAFGFGKGSGVPGITQTTILRANREAKPMQTVRAAYPPMALRIGMEGDVTLKVEVDPDGKVTRAEIIKGAGAGFDEEALKAVKQARFEPAQKDGQNVTAEFIYIYRFRMQR